MKWPKKKTPAGFAIEDSKSFAAWVRENPSSGLFTDLFDDPFSLVRDRIGVLLEQREAGAVLTRLTITGPPVPRADGHADYDEPDPYPASPFIILTRVALFVPFTAQVQSPTKGTESVQGALTYVVGNVNQPDNRLGRSWIDIDDLGQGRLMKPDHEQYQSRMLSVGEWLPSDYPPGSPQREGRPS